MIEIQPPHGNGDAVNKLNGEVKLYLAPSKVHGVGVFALRPISRGEKLYADQAPTVYKLPYSFFGKLFPEVKETLLSQFPQIVNGSMFVFPTTRWLAYMNCGTDGDENYDSSNDVALKDIPQNTEVLEDYTVVPNYDIVYPWLPKKKKQEEKE